jgi:DNA modification methylase
MMEKSLKKFGELNCFVFNRRSKQLVSGHQRQKVMLEGNIVIERRLDEPSECFTTAEGYVEYNGERFKYREVDMDDPTEKAANIAANRHGGEFDLSALNDWLNELDAMNVDMDLVGFTEEDLENLMAPVTHVPPSGDPDHVPSLPKEPKTKLGDIYQLGNHRLMCGDSTNRKMVEKLMGGERAQIAFTSPPYNAGDEVEIGSKGQKYNDHDDEMTGDDYLKLLMGFTENSLLFSEISIVNIQQLAGNKIQFIDYLHHFKNKLIDISIWNKTHGTPCLPKRCMNSAFEYVLFFSSEDNPKKTIKTAPMFHGSVNNVYTGEKQTANEFSKIHRATFPVHLPEYYINTFSTGSVLELFNGCGTTLIACEKLSRRCFAMELDPLYVDTTIERWETFTGKKAKLL